MKTVVIFNNFDNGGLTSVVLEGDFQHLHEKFINSMSTSDDECDQINEIAKMACDKHDLEEWYVHELPSFPNDEFYQAVKDGAKVIVTGCLL